MIPARQETQVEAYVCVRWVRFEYGNDDDENVEQKCGVVAVKRKGRWRKVFIQSMLGNERRGTYRSLMANGIA